MYYEICVSLNGVHFFATAERSLRSEEKYLQALEVFKQKFPNSEGYALSATRWEKTGKILYHEPA